MPRKSVQWVVVFKKRFLIFASVLLLAGAGPSFAGGETRVLRVMADPNNFPFSNAQLDGFENKIVALVAQELNATVEYTWISQHDRGFSTSLREAGCDLATGAEPAANSNLTTNPYCRSGYVILTRSDRALEIRSLDDARRQNLQVGVSVTASDQAVLALLSSHGLAERIHAYPISGSSLPLTTLADALAKGEIDLGIVPAPVGGFLAKRSGGVFSLTELDLEDQPSSAALCLAVRAEDPGLRDELNSALFRRRDEIAAILDSYGLAAAD